MSIYDRYVKITLDFLILIREFKKMYWVSVTLPFFVTDSSSKQDFNEYWNVAFSKKNKQISKLKGKRCVRMFAVSWRQIDKTL